MKITDNRGETRVRFKDLLYGDLFEDNEGNICIRMVTINTEFDSYNAVRLDGKVEYYEPSDEVTKLNVELIISN